MFMVEGTILRFEPQNGKVWLDLLWSNKPQKVIIKMLPQLIEETPDGSAPYQ
jgi:hypothetical protein